MVEDKADEQHSHEVAKHAEALAKFALADGGRFHKLAEYAPALTDAALAEYNTKTNASSDNAAVDAATSAMALATTASANDKEVARCTRDATAMAATVFVVGTQRQETAGAAQQPLDNEALAPTMPPLTPPMAVLSPPHCPTTYKEAVFSTMGGSPHATPPVVALSPRPSTTVDGPLQKARRHTQRCCCTGRHHHSSAPHPPDKVLPSHPHTTPEGLSTPTAPPMLFARATSYWGCLL